MISLNTVHTNAKTSINPLHSFANIDYYRVKKAGFPEAIFAQGKTLYQIDSIFDSMAEAAAAMNQQQQQQILAITYNSYT